MKSQKIERVVNPFIWIAGSQALGWGVLGMLLSTLLSWILLVPYVDSNALLRKRR